ncbi:MAG TPA: hypothetical protein VGN09_18015 [Vicinamibacteria bacterium]|jgi:hypothetical protein
MAPISAGAWLPVLRPPEWTGRGTIPSRLLFAGVEAGGRVSTQAPWVCFGRLGGGRHLTLLDAQVSASALDAIETEALANLSTLPFAWEHGEFEVSGRKVEMLACLDSPFAAERILDRGVLIAAAETLGARSLSVGIPREGTILVIALESPLEAQGRFAAVVAQHHAEAGGLGLTPAVFAVIDGRISGMADWVPEEARNDSLPQVRGFILTSDKTGRKTQGLTVLAEDMPSLEEALRQALSKVIEEKLFRAEYEPTVLIGIVRAVMPDVTEQGVARLKRRLVRFMKMHPIQSPTGPYDIDLALED